MSDDPDDAPPLERYRCAGPQPAGCGCELDTGDTLFVDAVTGRTSCGRCAAEPPSLTRAG